MRCGLGFRQVKAFFAPVVAAEAGEAEGKQAEDSQAFGRIFDFVQLIQRLGEFEDDEGRKAAGDGVVGLEGMLRSQFVDVMEQVPPMAESGAMGGPFGIAAFAPFGNVLRSDGTTAELFGEDFLDGGQGVEPGEDVKGASAVEEALIDLLADFGGQTGDFSGSCFHLSLVVEG